MMNSPMPITTHLADRQRTLAAQTSVAWIPRQPTWIELRGNDGVDLLHRLSTNDLTSLRVGEGLQTVLCTDKARIIDVVTVMRDESSVWLLGSEGTSGRIVSWLRTYIIADDVRPLNRSSDIAAIECMGPRSADAVSSMLDVDVRTMSLSAWKTVVVEHSATTSSPTELRIIRIPSPCELSYIIVGPKETLESIAATLTSSDVPELSSADDTWLRVTSGMGRIGFEWTESYNPLEAGLLHLTSFTKGCYIGQEVIARLDSYNKVKQRVVGLRGKGLQQGAKLLADGTAIGTVTTVTEAFTSDDLLALGYVRNEFAVDGMMLDIDHEGSIVGTVRVTALPMKD